MRNRLGWPAVVICLITAPALAIGSPALAAITHPQAAASGGLIGQVLVQGTVRAGGRPLADAAVTVYAWPPNSVLGALKPGKMVPTQVVGTAKTTPSGQYTVTVSSPAALQASVMPDGIVNLEIDAQSATSGASFSFSRRLVQTPDRIELTSALFEGAINDGASSPDPPEQADLFMQPVASQRIQSPDICVWELLKSYPPSPTIIGATYDITDNVTQTFIYGTDQSSSLGISTSNTGKYGSYTGSGTASFDSSSTTQFPSSTGAVSTYYETYFTQSLFGRVCQGHNGFASYETRPTKWDGGAITRATSAPSATYCVPYQKGAIFVKTDTEAYTFSAGFTIPIIGVTLSAQTGYSTTATVEYSMGRSHYICGTNDYPGGAPSRIVVGKP
jgi:hypothetical protein